MTGRAPPRSARERDVLTAVAFLASWLPARRASRVEPVEVLGVEG